MSNLIPEFLDPELEEEEEDPFLRLKDRPKPTIIGNKLVCATPRPALQHRNIWLKHPKTTREWMIDWDAPGNRENIDMTPPGPTGPVSPVLPPGPTFGELWNSFCGYFAERNTLFLGFSPAYVFVVECIKAGAILALLYCTLYLWLISPIYHSIYDPPPMRNPIPYYQIDGDLVNNHKLVSIETNVDGLGVAYNLTTLLQEQYRFANDSIAKVTPYTYTSTVPAKMFPAEVQRLIALYEEFSALIPTQQYYDAAAEALFVVEDLRKGADNLAADGPLMVYNQDMIHELANWSDEFRFIMKINQQRVLFERDIRELVAANKDIYDVTEDKLNNLTKSLPEFFTQLRAHATPSAARVLRVGRLFELTNLNLAVLNESLTIKDPLNKKLEMVRHRRSQISNVKLFGNRMFELMLSIRTALSVIELKQHYLKKEAVKYAAPWFLPTKPLDEVQSEALIGLLFKYEAMRAESRNQEDKIWLMFAPYRKELFADA